MPTVSTKSKNTALHLVAESLKKSLSYILSENEKDIKVVKKKNTKKSLIDRLRLNEDRMQDVIDSIETIIKLEDPIWKSNNVWTLENGLTINKMTVPLGVIGIIYESRPNVTVDGFSLALKSVNCILLHGSSSAIHSNKALIKAIKVELMEIEISPDVV